MTFTPLGEVVFVDDDPLVRAAIVQALELSGLPVRPFDRARRALPMLTRDFNGVIVSDIRMPEIDGLEFFKLVRAIDPTLPMILITGHGDVPMAVAALQDGAHDFLAKPFATDHLIASVRRGLERRQLELDNRRLRRMIEQPDSDDVLIGETPAMVRLRDTIDQMATAAVDVLIEGESGVGKSLIALMLHRRSTRRQHRFVTVNCAALPVDGARAILFGDGSLSAPKALRRGQIERAHRGTLFLKDIDALGPDTQADILHLIEEREIVPVGASDPIAVDCRVIAATRQNLQLSADAGSFRQNLFYAINVVRLRIPPLRERRSDIALLFAHFIDEASTQLRREPPPLSDRTRAHLIAHDWPGNVRELRSFAFQSAVGVGEMGTGDEVDLPPLPDRVGHFEASVIRSVLAECAGSVPAALGRLGIPRKTFYDKLSRHGIDIAAYRDGKIE